MPVANAGAAVFPLSGMHYVETWRIHETGRRKRLGEFMTLVSKGWTFASYKHAFGLPIPDYSLPAVAQ